MRQWVINFLHRHLLNAVAIDDIITIDPKKGIISIGGNPITSDELRALQAEIKALEGFRVWSVMTNSVRHIAQDKIFNKAQNFDEITYGKAMLFDLDTIESIARTLKSRV